MIVYQKINITKVFSQKKGLAYYTRPSTFKTIDCLNAVTHFRLTDLDFNVKEKLPP